VNESVFEMPTGSVIQLHPVLESPEEPVFSFKDSVVKLEVVDATLIYHIINNYRL